MFQGENMGGLAMSLLRETIRTPRRLATAKATATAKTKYRGPFDCVAHKVP
jgi:hypothetical protein